MGNIAVFTWKGRLPSDEELETDPKTRYSADFGEQWAYQATEPVATAILAAIRSAGYQTDADTPYFGEHAWYFGFNLGDQEYSVCVQWTVRGGLDAFSAEPAVQRGCLASLFGSSPEASAARPACAVLQAVLVDHPMVADLEWVERT